MNSRTRRLQAALQALAIGAVIAWTPGADAQTAPAAPAKPAQPARSTAKKPAAPRPPLVVEPRAMDLLKATSGRLAAARSLSFTAVASFEYPSKYGPPIVYTTRYDVVMQRPNKLRILMPGDGPASEFYYDGKTMVAYAPVENLAAFADTPPTIEAALVAAFRTAAIYFPFSDLLAADPYAAMADGVKLAFYVGPSGVVGGTQTDMLVWANDAVFVQIWIGREDKLPRRMRAVFLDDPLGRRHDLELSNWQIDPSLSADLFTSEKAKAAGRMPFASPAPPPQGARPIIKGTTAKPAPKSN